MLRKVSLTLFLSFIFVTCFAKVPENFHTFKSQVIHYVNSGQYQKGLATQIAKAKAFLKESISDKKPGEKLAIILDIDETSLSNLRQIMTAYQLPNDMGDTIPKRQIITVQNMFHDPAIQPTLNLYRYAIKHGVTVFFITGRYSSDRSETIKNLKHVGFKKFKALIMRTPRTEHETAAAYKTQVRKSIVNEGYTIVLNVGDQYSDIHGGYSLHTVKLPNPFYFTP